MVKVSAIIPMYNAEKYLKECMDSLCGQTLREIEIICIDDGSTDATLDIVSEYMKKDLRVTLLRDCHKGVSAARNAGLRKACGQYIIFVDADDIVEVHAFEELYRAANCFGRMVDIVVFGSDTFPEDKSINKNLQTHNEYIENFNAGYVFQKEGIIPYVCGKMYRRKLFVESHICFDEELSLGEDQLLQFEIFPLARDVLFVNNIFYHYRVHCSGSAVEYFNSDILKKCRLHMKQVEKIENIWRRYGLFPNYKIEFCSWIFSFLYPDIMWNLSGKRRKKMCREFLIFLIRCGIYRFYFRLSDEEKRWYRSLILHCLFTI